MTWYAWALVIWLGLSALILVGFVGREKKEKTYTASTAVCQLIFNGLAIWAVVSLAAH